jgi:large subunit ribosomal protein L21
MTIIVASGARQYLVTPGQHIIVNSLAGEIGDMVPLTFVHAYGEDEAVKEVSGKIIGHQRGEKIIVAKYKPKSNYRRRYGPRQEETIIEVVVGGTVVKASVKKIAKDVETPKAKKPVAKKVTKVA